MTTADQRSLSVFGRALLLLEPFRHTDALTLTELAERTGFPRSTTHRMLTQLVTVGWIRREGTTYHLGTKMVELGSLAQTHDRLHRAAQEGMYRLHRQTGAAVHLAVADGDDVLYLDKVGGRWAASALDTRVGQRRARSETPEGTALSAHQAGGDPTLHESLVGRDPDRPIGCVAVTFDVALGGPAVLSLVSPSDRMPVDAGRRLLHAAERVCAQLSG
ncbi:helix-turn-helix domain-containing protein [Gordonia sp. zg691]|uniref:IclR family transcriptional regulator n=1 Tax=Gordonia jinghuaiqii TaxID=2758710 RepID=UPI0016621D43|nr:helix-turn-helix domain-containing protein [Gordonia jinghuaiqii]MBD0862557.1 helix-turn-helix domain-containing protein [Gordonia jinghuaiqii]